MTLLAPATTASAPSSVKERTECIFDQMLTQQCVVIVNTSQYQCLFPFRLSFGGEIGPGDIGGSKM